MGTITSVAFAPAINKQGARVIDKCSNGVLWAVFASNGNNLEFWYSTNDGVSWTEDTAGEITGLSNSRACMYIDENDYAHLLYHNGSNIYYRRGTPNAGKTAWTWGSPRTVGIGGTSGANLNDIVAFSVGTDTYAFCAFHYYNGTFGRHETHVIVIKCTSDGTTSQLSDSTLANVISTSMSLDFDKDNSTSKVPATNSNVYVAWQDDSFGSLYFTKVGYSAGPFWSAGSNTTLNTDTFGDVGCFYDSIDDELLIIGYQTLNNKFMIYDRDTANTTSNLLYDGSAEVDDPEDCCSFTLIGQDIYIMFNSTDESDSLEDLKYGFYDKSANTLSSWTILDDAVSQTDTHPNLMRVGETAKVRAIYIGDTTSTYDVTYWDLTLNTTPDVPTDLTVTSVSTDTTPNFSCSVNDADFSGSEQVKARFTVQTAAGAAVGTVDSSFRSSAGTCTAEYTSALSTGQYRVAARAIDDDGAESADTAWVYFDVTTLVTKDQQYIWDTVEQVNKDLAIDFDTILYTPAEVDLALDWAVYGQIQKHLEIIFDVTTPLEVDFDLVWDNRNGWVDIPIYDATWTEKALAP